jgi:hypothetical protein
MGNGRTNCSWPLRSFLACLCLSVRLAVLALQAHGADTVGTNRAYALHTSWRADYHDGMDLL